MSMSDEKMIVQVVN